MNVNRKLRTVALIAGLLAFSASSALALTASQVKAIKQAVNAVPVPEMPAKAAALVKDAEAKDREAVAVTAVKAILLKHRAAAPVVVAAVIKVAPEVAAAVTIAAADLVPNQSRAIAKAQWQKRATIEPLLHQMRLYLNDLQVSQGWLPQQFLAAPSHADPAWPAAPPLIRDVF